MSSIKKPNRIEALDFLRGFFIIMIIIDHLFRWPSFLTIFTGEGMLWSNASDGFIIIAGLLVGYIRGFKSKDAPFAGIAKKLAFRSVGLYFWSVVITLILVAIQWSIAFKVPMPNIDPATGDWPQLIWQTLTMSYSHPWVFFLHLYTFMMLLAIPAIWLIRKNLSWLLIVVSIGGLIVSQFFPSFLLERQAMFFIPAVIGFRLDDIRNWIVSLKKPVQDRLSFGLISFFGLTIVLASLWHFHPQLLGQGFHDFLTTTFNRMPIGFGATIIAFAWFIGMFALFQKALPFLKKRLEWLILPFGKLSLSAYIVHGVPVLITSFIFGPTTDIFLNTALGIFSVMLVWGLIHLKIVKKLIPQ